MVKLAVVCSSIEARSKWRVEGSICQPEGASRVTSPDRFRDVGFDENVDLARRGGREHQRLARAW